MPKGTAVEEAVKLARDIARFPQECMKADRLSVYGAFYHTNMREALSIELERGGAVLVDAREGAKRFAEGKKKSKL